jgi:hypothetical protein
MAVKVLVVRTCKSKEQLEHGKWRDHIAVLVSDFVPHPLANFGVPFGQHADDLSVEKDLRLHRFAIDP